ncbi:hypothetical protein EBZ35_04215 [bacterium]|nr:hypothetical protein [bacterium]
MTEDPAGQAFNPYLYAGNNPLMYVDPDGEFFTELFSAICPGLGTLLGAMLDGAAISAATNVAVQLSMTGQVNWNAVGQSAIGGAIGAGVFNMVGGVSDAFGFAQGGIEKIAMHSIAGGISSSLQGGNFWSGAIGAGVGQALSPTIMGMTGNNGFGSIAGAALVGGAASWATGGDFVQGALAGGYGMAFNELGRHAWFDTREERSPVDKFNDAKRSVNKYGPDVLGVAGSGLQMVPHPGVKGVGFGLALAGNAWGGYNTYKNPTLSDSLFYIRGAIPFLPPIFGITSGSASMMYNYARP